MRRAPSGRGWHSSGAYLMRTQLNSLVSVCVVFAVGFIIVAILCMTLVFLPSLSGKRRVGMYMQNKSKNKSKSTSEIKSDIFSSPHSLKGKTRNSHSYGRNRGNKSSTLRFTHRFEFNLLLVVLIWLFSILSSRCYLHAFLTNSSLHDYNFWMHYQVGNTKLTSASSSRASTQDKYWGLSGSTRERLEDEIFDVRKRDI